MFDTRDCETSASLPPGGATLASMMAIAVAILVNVALLEEDACWVLVAIGSKLFDRRTRFPE